MLFDSEMGLFVLGNFLSVTCAEVFLPLCLAECLRSLFMEQTIRSLLVQVFILVAFPAVGEEKHCLPSY